MKKNDHDLQKDVQDELTWEPSLDSAHIGVAASDGAITLTGHVPTFKAKLTAEKAAKRVQGVRAVANDLEVRLPTSLVRDDTDIAEAAVRALRWSVSIPDYITSTVKDGWVTLEGEVAWDFQRRAAYQEVRELAGVKGVTNLIRIKPRVSAVELRSNIESAFKRSAQIDAGHVKVEVNGGEVTLRGSVASWSEHDAASAAAWSAPGVDKVRNLLTVEETILAYL